MWYVRITIFCLVFTALIFMFAMGEISSCGHTSQRVYGIVIACIITVSAIIAYYSSYDVVPKI